MPQYFSIVYDVNSFFQLFCGIQKTRKRAPDGALFKDISGYPEIHIMMPVPEIYAQPSVMNAYLTINTAATARASPCTSFFFPVVILMMQYVIRPTAMPFAIE